jgi:hypothetical protein
VGSLSTHAQVDFFNLPNPSSLNMALRFTQPLTEMSTRNPPGGNGQPAREAGNLTAICEPTVLNISQPLGPDLHSPSMMMNSSCQKQVVHMVTVL